MTRTENLFQRQTPTHCFVDANTGAQINGYTGPISKAVYVFFEGKYIRRLKREHTDSFDRFGRLFFTHLFQRK